MIPARGSGPEHSIEKWWNAVSQISDQAADSPRTTSSMTGVIGLSWGGSHRTRSWWRERVRTGRLGYLEAGSQLVPRPYEARSLAETRIARRYSQALEASMQVPEEGMTLTDHLSTPPLLESSHTIWMPAGGAPSTGPSAYGYRRRSWIGTVGSTARKASRSTGGS